MKYNDFDLFRKECIHLGLEIKGRPRVFKNVSLHIRGVNNTIEFSPTSKIDGCSIFFYSDLSSIFIGDDSKLSGNIKIGYNSKLQIGKKLSITGGLSVGVSDETRLKIGDDCMFGIDVSISTHDYHPIFDYETGERINFSKDIVIGNHVWLANHVKVLKGSNIGNGSVIAQASILTSACPCNVIMAGNPARIIKTSIFWDRASLNTSHPKGISKFKDL